MQAVPHLIFLQEGVMIEDTQDHIVSSLRGYFVFHYKSLVGETIMLTKTLLRETWMQFKIIPTRREWKRYKGRENMQDALGQPGGTVISVTDVPYSELLVVSSSSPQQMAEISY